VRAFACVSAVSIALTGCGLVAEKPAGETAQDSASADTCSPDACVGTCCDGVCVDVFTDPDNCGACGITCLAANASTSCEAGACALDTCDEGWGDCDADEATGCEAEVSCEPGAACATECGSVGSTWCGDPCAPSCVTLDETCNGLDDDCNGACDEGALPGCRGGVYRSSGAIGHLYGRDESEISSLGQNLERSDYFFVYEAEATDLVPLYRCVKGNGKRFLTRSATCEGSTEPELVLGWVAGVERCGATPLYRLYTGASGNHFYTLSAAERDNAVSAYGYTYESIAAWVWTAP
jgi:hypothetical protein